jgi:hypothetical protein
MDSIEHIEEFKLMLMTVSNICWGLLQYQKWDNDTITDVRIIFQYAIKANLFYIRLIIGFILC